MASICNDPNGRRRILFIGADGQRKTIRLGKVARRYAESVKVKIEDLVSSAITGHASADETSRWLANLDSELYDKLAQVGLAKRQEVATLGVFTQTYIHNRVDIKPGTRTNLKLARGHLLSLFDHSRPLRDFTPGDAEDFRMYLIRRRKAENTVRRICGRARQFFRAALQRGLIGSNPFSELATAVRANPGKFYFVSADEAAKVLDACPDAQWRLIFALARYGGLRCPSEILTLTWTDVNWERHRICVHSPKTEHHEGKDTRMIPLFAELRPHLLEVFEQAKDGDEYLITRYRNGNANLRTQLFRIIRKAGLSPWPKPFQNLRSTRETELAEKYPMHVVCAWLGNSQPVAMKHYLQLTDEHFEQATRDEDQVGAEAAQKVAQQSAAEGRNASHEFLQKRIQHVDAAKVNDDLRRFAKQCKNAKMTPTGFEPVLPA